MRHICCVALFAAATVLADKPAVAPAYTPPVATAKQDSYGSPVATAKQDSYGSPVAPAQDSYGSPAVAPSQDSYGSPQAPVVQQDEYGSPQAAVQESYAAPAAAAPVGQQGYYYYYYPVKQNNPSYAAPKPADTGLFGGIGAIIAAILGKKVLLIALAIAGLLVLAAFGVNIGINGRSFQDLTARAMPFMTEDNLSILTDFVETAINVYEDL